MADKRAAAKQTTGDRQEARKPHYHGHRQRLKSRFLKHGPDALQDYELLELLLFMAQPRGDMKPIAKALLAHFKSFGRVVSAPPEALKTIDGVGDAAVAAIKIAQASALAFMREEVLNRPVLSSWQQVLTYLQASAGYGKTEQFRLLFLDHKNNLIADEIQQQGTVNQTPIYPREVVKRALELGAAALIMVHNHPTGDVTPSGADIAVTKQVAEAAERLGIALHDHVIVAPGDHASFKSLGLL